MNDDDWGYCTACRRLEPVEKGLLAPHRAAGSQVLCRTRKLSRWRDPAGVAGQVSRNIPISLTRHLGQTVIDYLLISREESDV
jgi:hypothetical protein